MSDQANVFSLMAKVMADVRSVKKADTNTHFKFQFRGIDTVLDHVGPALRTHGIVVIPELREQKSETVGKSVRVTVTVAYTFYGPAGDHVTAVVPGEAMDAQDKASSKAMSVAFRTALIQAFAIPTGERDPHAGEPAGRKLAQLQNKVLEAGNQRGWDMAALSADYEAWSKGADIQAATEKDLTEYLKHLEPGSSTTMQRNTAQPEQRQAVSAPVQRENGIPVGPSKAQLAKLHATLNDCRVASREEKLQVVSTLIGRKVDSSAALTFDEARSLLDSLDKVSKDEDPAAALNLLLANANAAVPS